MSNRWRPPTTEELTILSDQDLLDLAAKNTLARLPTAPPLLMAFWENAEAPAGTPASKTYLQ